MNKENCLNVLSALSSMYISIHIFDLDIDEMETCKSNEHIDAWGEDFDGAQAKTFNVMKNIVKKDHIDSIISFVDFETLKERLKDKPFITEVFEGKFNGWCRARFVPMEYGEDGYVKRVVYTVECIDSDKKRENYLLYLAQTDLMTNISNRGFGEKTISDYLIEKRQGLFCLFDVDKFKRINDKYGHDTGDKVLIAVAECMQRVKREDDVIMRLGGDEFAMYFVDVVDKENGKSRINELLHEIDRIKIDNFTEKIGVSLGAAFYKEGLNFEQIYRIADEGVYISKTQKGSSSHICE